MAQGKCFAVTQSKKTWEWFETDARGRVNRGGGVSGYARKDTATRGAKRALGAKARLVEYAG